MTLEQLRIFVAVAERGHMTKAATALGVTQSTASAAVSSLEARHGVRLFDRVGRGLELSEAGRLFLVDAKAILTRVQVAADTLTSIAGLKRGTVRIAASQTVASYWLPRRLAEFASMHRSIDVSLAVSNTLDVARAVAEGDCDIGFAEGAVGEGPYRRSTVGGDRLSVYASPHHPKAGLKRVDVSDLAAARWVVREPGSGTRSEVEATLAERGIHIHALEIVLTLPSNEAVLSAAASSDLLAAVSDLAAAPHVAAGTLQRLAYDLTDRRFTLLRHKDRRESPSVSAFLSMLDASSA